MLVQNYPQIAQMTQILDYFRNPICVICLIRRSYDSV